MAWSKHYKIPRIELIWVIVAAMAPVIVFAANGMVVLLALSVLAAPGLALLPAEIARLLRTPVGLALLGLIAWTILSLAWTPYPADAAEKIARLALLWLAGITVFASARHADHTILRHVQWVFPGVVIVALVFYLLELAGSAAIIRALTGLNNAPLTQITDPVLRDTYRIILGFNEIGRGGAILSIFLWPALAMTLLRKHGAWLAAGLALVTFLVLLALPVAAAPLALITGAAAWVLCFATPRRGPYLLAGLSIVLIFAAPAAAYYVKQPETIGIAARTLPGSWQHRVAIWHFAAERIAEKPVSGWGFDASRHVEGGATPFVVLRPDDSKLYYSGVTLLPLHPHNGVLQIWLELGLPGALLALLLTTGLWRAIAPSPAPRYTSSIRINTATAAAVCASALTLACLSFGLWQNWWQSCFWLAAALVCLAARAFPDQEMV